MQFRDPVLLIALVAVLAVLYSLSLTTEFEWLRIAVSILAVAALGLISRELATMGNPLSDAVDRAREWFRSLYGTASLRDDLLVDYRPEPVVRVTRRDIPAKIELGPDRRGRTVGLLYATTRGDRTSTATSQDGLFDDSRNQDLKYGAVKVAVPAKRSPGQFNVPFQLRLTKRLQIRLRTKSAEHFWIDEITPLAETDFLDFVRTASHTEALIFVHGYNTTFSDAVLKMAQIVFDTRSAALPVVFAWSSHGTIHGYGYDKESAVDAKAPFLALYRSLFGEGVRKVHVIAHSMGNLVVLNSLELADFGDLPLARGELVMAAADIPADLYPRLTAAVRHLFRGMTLYASSADQVLRLSKIVGGDVPRAGDIIAGKPIIGPDFQTIDVTAVGGEMLGHGVYSEKTTILSDIKILLETGRRPPHERLTNILAVPDDAEAPQYWRYSDS